MNWLMLIDRKQLTELDQQSFDNSVKGVLIFKHSTRCSISDLALNRLERTWGAADKILPVYYLDLLKYQSLSAEIAFKYHVMHESPQILIIKDGKCIYSASHSSISFQEINTLILNQPNGISN